MVYYILKSYRLDSSAFDIFRILSREKNCFFLDSSLSGNSLGRYSFLGIEPFRVFSSKSINSFEEIRREFSVYDKLRFSSKFPFWGGAVGYLSYDLGVSLERKVERRDKADFGIPACFFAFYNTVVIIDHYKKLFYILALGIPERSSAAAKALAKANFKRISGLLKSADCYRGNQIWKKKEKGKLISSFTKPGYIRAIEAAKKYISAGDIYQVNLSQQFQAKSSLPASEIYRRLRNISPACFSVYFDAGEFQIISSSPERFLRLEGRRVSTRPMKGTRPRAKDKIRDAGLRKELLKSPKDKAELMMIIDLERNDLGRVCSYSSITVPRLRELEEYNTVFQTTATIEGSLHKNKDRYDLLSACFPGGSITGCPKIRAMQIIEELEPVRRAIYTGAFGYLSFSGDMDFNILIRSILKKGNNLYFGSGGGIVADSDPEDEYNETLVKAKGMFEAIK